eukprot:scaffold30462_cov28-Tisochrysis_lutea.AAC.10
MKEADTTKPGASPAPDIKSDTCVPAWPAKSHISEASRGDGAVKSGSSAAAGAAAVAACWPAVGIDDSPAV